MWWLPVNMAARPTRPAIKTCSAKCSKAFTRGMLENKHLNTCKRKINGFSNALSLGCDADLSKYR